MQIKEIEKTAITIIEIREIIPPNEVLNLLKEY
jgi:hypothetical protein